MIDAGSESELEEVKINSTNVSNEIVDAYSLFWKGKCVLANIMYTLNTEKNM